VRTVEEDPRLVGMAEAIMGYGEEGQVGGLKPGLAVAVELLGAGESLKSRGVLANAGWRTNAQLRSHGSSDDCDVYTT